MFEDFERMERRFERFKEFAQNAPKGLSADQLVPGALVTMSACKNTGDRSFTQDIYEVVACNACQVLVKPTQLVEADYFDGKTRSVMIYEREFYTADHLAETLRAEARS